MSRLGRADDDLATVLREQGVVAIVRGDDREAAVATARDLLTAGLRAVEISLTTPGALDAIAEVVAGAPAGTLVGVGTALTAEDVRAARAAGARFVVSPIAAPEVVATARRLDLPVLPGVATPTEAVAAAEAGATAVKVFPASLWSPAVLREVRTALPWLDTVPTGGVDLASLPAWIEAGAAGVGLGGALTRAPDVREAARHALEAVVGARRRRDA